MQIREAIQSDSPDLFLWRNDVLSRRMFKNPELLTFEEHSRWFESARINPHKYILIGYNQNKKIGVCRFDLEKDNNLSEISININPKFRGRGFGQKLLKLALKEFKQVFNGDIVTNIRIENLASIKIFEKCGFYFLEKNDEYILMKNKMPQMYDPASSIRLERIFSTEDQIKVLFKLLNQRTHPISHSQMPSFGDHSEFVKSNPYRVWYLVYCNIKCIGSFYIQDDNSIGINIDELDQKKINFCLNFIKTNFYPFPEQKSKIPSYFYLNAPYTDKNFLSILKTTNLTPIQTSYKL